MADNRVAIYIRVSTTHQIDKDSLPMQKKDLIAYANLILNTDDYVIFEDAGYSGKNTDRPDFQRMLKKIRNHEFTHLLVWKIDRISRNLLDFATLYNELKTLGVTFVSKNEQFDTSTAMGEAMLKIILVFAELERNMTSERVTATMISRANNGMWNGGRIPFGYDYDAEAKTFSINEKEAEVVKLIHDEYENHKSLIAVARYLNSKNLVTRRGYNWTPSTVSIILKSEFYTGDYQYNLRKEGSRLKHKPKDEWVVIEHHHPAIISHEQKDRITNILEHNTKLVNDKEYKRDYKHIHIFSKLLYCTNCGSILKNQVAYTRTSDRMKYSKYVCHSNRITICPGKSTSDFYVGEFFFNYILNLINAKKNVDKIHNTKQLERRLLKGSVFDNIEHINANDLSNLYDILTNSDIKSNVFENDASIKDIKSNESEISNLKLERQRYLRALDRLRTLYLYSEDAMTEREYIIEKSKLTSLIDEIDEQIGILSSNSWEHSITDEEFMYKASSFILTKKLEGRNYINYKRLAVSVDADVLQQFVVSVVDNIQIYNGKIKSITFKNGLSQSFINKTGDAN